MLLLSPQKQTWKWKLEPLFQRRFLTWTSSAKEPACHHANRGNSASSGAETHAHKTGNPPPGYQTPHSQHDHAGVEKWKIFFEDFFFLI